MGELVFHVQFGVVGGARLPHFPDDFEPALPQAAQGLGVALVGKEVHRAAQALVAGAAQVDFVDLAGLVA